MNYTLTKKELSGLKAALTRAKKKGPDAVLEEVAWAYAVFEEKGYPDCWHIWKSANTDALFAKKGLGGFIEAGVL